MIEVEIARRMAVGALVAMVLAAGSLTAPGAPIPCGKGWGERLLTACWQEDGSRMSAPHRWRLR